MRPLLFVTKGFLERSNCDWVGKLSASLEMSLGITGRVTLVCDAVAPSERVKGVLSEPTMVAWWCIRSRPQSGGLEEVAAAAAAAEVQDSLDVLRLCL